MRNLRKAAFFCFLVLVSVFAHLLIFFAYENINVQVKSENSERQSVLVDITSVSPSKGGSESDSDPLSDSSEISAQNTTNPEEERDIIEYELGAFSKDTDEQSAERFGTALRKGLPDLSFDYGDKWYEVTQHYFEEVDIIFHPERVTFFVIKWQDGEPLAQKTSGRTVVDYIASMQVLFADKAKNRKEEFKTYPPLKYIYEEIRQEYFSDLYEPDIRFVGVMPLREVAMIVKEIEKLSIRPHEVVTHLLVTYKQSEDGRIRINVNPIQ